MHAFHERLARVGPAALSHYGFALAGGYAVQAHGLVSRLSEDVDLFTTMDTEATFPAVVAAAVAAYRQDGLNVEVLLDSPGFARLFVADPDQRVTAKVELGIHVRSCRRLHPHWSEPRRWGRLTAERLPGDCPGQRRERTREDVVSCSSGWRT